MNTTKCSLKTAEALLDVDGFSKKKLSDIRSEIHLVRSSIVSSGQFARALKKYILRLDLGIWRALEGNTDTRALKALGDSRHWDTRHLGTRGALFSRLLYA